ncbi:unnamed protein product [Euphydryas editha]|uniref:Uncharacterized protein n=1 Tax=Euphydryas editha TaxID=104508 RepID=A0AAU9U1T3_EUPED|nr:unnamed protein product [Euphydryas editha]
MFELDTAKLIKAVQTRPALYHKDDKLYHSHKVTHRKDKDKIWREVAEEVHENWNQLSELDKVEYVRKVQKRWKGVRTCFSTELKKQKKENLKRETDQKVKKRKRYEYFDILLFLMDTINGGDKTRDSDDSDDPFDSSYQPEEMIYDYGEPSSDVKNVDTMKTETIPEQNYPKPQVVCERDNILEEKVQDILKDIKKDKDDEDRPTDGGDETRDNDDLADPFDSSYQPEEMIHDNGEPSSDFKIEHTIKIETIPEQNYPQLQVVCERNNTLEEKVQDMLKDIKKDKDEEDRPTDGGDETRDSDDSADHFDSSYQPEEIISDYGESSSDVKNAHTIKIGTIPEQNYPQPQVVCERNNTLEEKVLDMLKDIKKNEDDEDRQFMLSLVPTFRKLNAKQKLTARIEILKVLHNISFEQN